MWKLQHPRGPARDQRAARAGRPAGPADDDLAGRDPQLLRPGVPGEAGRAAGPLHDALVHSRRRSASSTCSAPSTAAREHSAMVGRVVVMEPADYERWLAGGTARAERWRSSGDAAVPRSTAAAAATAPSATVHAPPLDGVYGQPVPLAGRPERRRRRALHPRLDPAAREAQVVAGLRAGHAVLRGPDRARTRSAGSSIAYIKSLGATGDDAMTQPSAATARPASYLDDGYALALVAADHRPQADRASSTRSRSRSSSSSAAPRPR